MGKILSMPKGKRFNGGYCSLEEDGYDFREISEAMAKIGVKMNHSSARNWLIRSMKKFAEAVYEDSDLTPEQICEISRTPSFQSLMCSCIIEIETGLVKER